MTKWQTVSERGKCKDCATPILNENVRLKEQLKKAEKLLKDTQDKCYDLGYIKMVSDIAEYFKEKQK